MQVVNAILVRGELRFKFSARQVLRTGRVTGCDKWRQSATAADCAAQVQLSFAFMKIASRVTLAWPCDNLLGKSD